MCNHCPANGKVGRPIPKLSRLAGETERHLCNLIQKLLPDLKAYEKSSKTLLGALDLPDSVCATVLATKADSVATHHPWRVADPDQRTQGLRSELLCNLLHYFSERSHPHYKEAKMAYGASIHRSHPLRSLKLSVTCSSVH